MKKLLLTLVVFGGLVPATQAQLANAGMESWRTYTAGFLPPVTLEAPNSWFGADSLLVGLSFFLGTEAGKQLYKSSDAHSGSFAARMVTREQGDLGTIPGILMNAVPEFNLLDSSISFKGGTNISERVDSVYAWVKFEHPGEFPEDDTAQITAIAIKAGNNSTEPDSIVGIGICMIPPTAAYTQVGLKLNYTSPLQPDKLVLVFSSSPFNMETGFGGTALEGSSLLVDDVSMVVESLSLPALGTAAAVKVFPNPASDKLYVATGSQERVTLEVYNAAGQRVVSQEFEATVELPVSGLAAGSYFYHLRGSKGALVQQGKFQIAR